MDLRVEIADRVSLQATRFLLASEYERVWRIRLTFDSEYSTTIPWLNAVEPPSYQPRMLVRDSSYELQLEQSPDPVIKMQRLLASQPADFAWVYIPPYVYIRIHERDEPIQSAFGAMVAYETALLFTRPYFYSHQQYAVTEDAAFANGWKIIKPYLLSDYTTKMTADTGGVLKFNSATVELMKEVGGVEKFIGNPVIIYDENDQILDMLMARDGTDGYETSIIKARDYRSAVSDTIPRVQFDRTKIVQYALQNVIAMSDKTGKKYVQEAVGYCKGVPAVCINDYSFDKEAYELVANVRMTAAYRYHYLCSGTFTLDNASQSVASTISGVAIYQNTGVEVEGDNGWFWLAPTSFTLVQQRTLINADNAIYKTVTMLRVPATVTNPPKSGTSVPDYGSGSARPIRVTGTFHTEIANITRPFEVFKFMFQNFSSMPWNESYFNITHITSELAKLQTGPIGIFFEKPKELFKALQDVQNGCLYPFQTIILNGKVDVLVNRPTDPFTKTMQAYEISNIADLKCDMNAEDYVSGLSIQYNQTWKGDDDPASYTNDNTRNAVVALLGIPKDKIIKTLLRDRANAITRYNAENAMLLGVCPSITGLEIIGFQKHKDLRPFQKIVLALPGLTDKTEWMITAVTINWVQETIGIDIRALPTLDLSAYV